MTADQIAQAVTEVFGEDVVAFKAYLRGGKTAVDINDLKRQIEKKRAAQRTKSQEFETEIQVLSTQLADKEKAAISGV